MVEREPSKPPERRVALNLIDLERYPIDRPASPGYRCAVEEVRAALAAEACAVLSGFLRAEQLALLRREAQSLQGSAVYVAQVHNPYFSAMPAGLSGDDPRCYRGSRTNGMVPAEAFARDGPLWMLYRLLELRRFLQDCLEEERLHCYADPLGAMVLSVQKEGQAFAWHFDTNDFAVTLLLQEPLGGGTFEYAPNIRSAHDECYDAVAEVLAERTAQTKQLTLREGDLQLFRGRHALHRVTAVEGEIARLIAVLGFTKEPDVLATPERAQQAWGRVHPAQLAAAGRRRRADPLID